jgi:hypothetical protein
MNVTVMPGEANSWKAYLKLGLALIPFLVMGLALHPFCILWFSVRTSTATTTKKKKRKYLKFYIIEGISVALLSTMT